MEDMGTWFTNEQEEKEEELKPYRLSDLLRDVQNLKEKWGDIPVVLQNVDEEGETNNVPIKIDDNYIYRDEKSLKEDEVSPCTCELAKQMGWKTVLVLL